MHLATKRSSLWVASSATTRIVGHYGPLRIAVRQGRYREPTDRRASPPRGPFPPIPMPARPQTASAASPAVPEPPAALPTAEVLGIPLALSDYERTMDWMDA